MINTFYALLPQSSPTVERLLSAKIVAHRGIHDSKSIENTLAAFKLCVEHKIWGIECDLRWTKDHIPIILHDSHGQRLFGRPDVVPAQLTWEQLHKEIPQIPNLYEVLECITGHCHLMLELKSKLSEKQQVILLSALEHLKPHQDYHLLSLQPEYFENLYPSFENAFIYVAETNLKPMALMALKNNCSGLAGHFKFISDELNTYFQEQNKFIAVGYIDSVNSLFREINRNFEWFFSNKPLILYKYLNSLTKP